MRIKILIRQFIKICGLGRISDVVWRYIRRIGSLMMGDKLLTVLLSFKMNILHFISSSCRTPKSPVIAI